MTEMMEKSMLLPEDRQRELRKVEAELLLESGGKLEEQSKTLSTLSPCGLTDSAAFLLGYQLLAIGANIYMLISLEGPAGWYYLANAIFSLVGLVGLRMLQPTLMLIYGGYLCASFLFSTMISGGAVLFIMQRDICNAIGDILPGQEVRNFCLTSPGRFQALALTTVFAELLLEFFVMWQLKRMYNYAIKRGGGGGPSNQPNDSGKPKGKLGSIAIIQA